MQVLDPEQWLPRRQRHEQRIDALTAGHRARAERGEKHAIEDFLFTYYSFTVGRIRRWHPGPGIELLGSDEELLPLLETGSYRRTAAGAVLDVEEAARRRRTVLDRARLLLRATADRDPVFGCFGLHEWAMVYQMTPEQLRHSALGLRLSPAQTDQVVEQGRLICTHFDAFRFFTPQATPLNAHQPTRATQVELEQPGCLHANMDLYRWSAALLPLVPSELVADAFALAREIRYLDMRASPYDVSPFGLAPVAIETPAGRAEYARSQRRFNAHAQVLRGRLLAALERLPD